MLYTKNFHPKLGKNPVIAVLPDIQNYTGGGGIYFPYLQKSIEWLRHAKDNLNIDLLLQVGDLTNRNQPDEWVRARSAFARLDGHLPYVLAIGNHDLGDNEIGENRHTRFNEHFNLRQNTLNINGHLESYATGSLENRLCRHRIGREDWLILVLEFGPREGVLTWADAMLKKHAGKPTLLLTHEYIDQLSYCEFGEVRHSTPDTYNSPHCYKLAELPGGAACGENVWERLVLPHSQIRTVVNGHYRPFQRDLTTGESLPVAGLAEAHRTDVRPDGTKVSQFLFNAQWEINGGNGWMLFLEILPSKQVIARKYSPLTQAQVGNAPPISV